MLGDLPNTIGLQRCVKDFAGAVARVNGIYNISLYIVRMSLNVDDSCIGPGFHRYLRTVWPADKHSLKLTVIATGDLLHDHTPILGIEALIKGVNNQEARFE